MTFTPRRHPSIPADIWERMLTVGTSTLGHRRDHGFVDELTPIRRPIRLAGLALTVQIGEYDAGALTEATERLEPGHVLVVSQVGTGSRASIGGIVSYLLKSKGAAGLIIDGAITDYDQLLQWGMPVYFRSVSPRVTKRLGNEGFVGTTVPIGGTVISDGDYLFGDSDGVAVLHPNEAGEITASLAEREVEEVNILRRIDEAQAAELSAQS
ncbi:MAG TPA: RraA family protein [Glaciihabitans sp.]|jgi:regulator of RNase E activity RraA|nr:RraA family protein [Glaciihabitans sp.]